MLLFHSVSDSRRSLLHEATTAGAGIHDADFMPDRYLQCINAENAAAFPNSEGTADECPCSKTLFHTLVQPAEESRVGALQPATASVIFNA